MDAYVDTSGVARGLQAKINREVAGVRAKIQAQVETRGLVTQARRAAAEASKVAVVKFKTQLDTRGLVGQAKAAAAAASKAGVVRLRTEIDQGSLSSATAKIALAARDRKATIKVEADTAAATAKIKAAAAAGGGGGSAKGLRDVDTAAQGAARSANAAAASLAKVGLMAGGIYQAVAAVGNLAGGLIAMGAAAANASATLAVIPNLLGAAAQGIGVLLAGFSGIGDAVTALGEADTASAANSQAAGQARAAAAQQVEAAQQAVANAHRAAAEAARQAAEAVRDARWEVARSAEAVRDAREAYRDTQYSIKEGAEDMARGLVAAEENVRRSHQATQQAQENLTRAREYARERIEDLNRELRLSAADEAAATFAVEEARRRLEDVGFNAASTEAERDAAEVNLALAEAALERQVEARQDLADATEEANEQGVEGSDEVKDAEQQVLDAIQAEKDARYDLKEARQDARRQGVLDARAIRNAEEDVRDALHAQQEAREGLVDAQRAQAESARQSAQQIKAAQQGLAQALAGQASAGNTAAASALKLTTAMDKLSPAGQRFARFIAGTLLPRLREMRNAIQQALLPPVQQGIERAMPFLDTLQNGLVGTARVVGRFIRQIGTVLGKKTFNDDIGKIMGTNNKALRIFLSGVKDLLFVFKDLALATGPTLLVPFAKWFRSVAAAGREAASTGEKTGKMAAFFERARERLAVFARIVRNIATALFGLGKAALPAGDQLSKSFEGVTKEWSDWANSDVGQEKMGEFFDGVVPVTEAIGNLIAQLFELFAKLSQGGQGPVLGFVKVLTLLVDGLNFLMTIPFVSSVIGWTLTLAGAGGAIGLVALQMKKLGAGLATMARVTGLTKLWNLFSKSLLATRIQVYALTAAQKIAAVASRIWAAATRLLGTAMKFVLGPWGLLIIGIVAGLILAYKKFEGFRKVVDAVFGFVKDVALDVFGWMVDTLFPAVWGAVKKVGDFFSWLWEKAIKPAWAAIQKAVSLAWNYYYKPIFKALIAVVKVVGAIFSWLWEKAIKPAMEFTAKAISVAWEVARVVFALFKIGVKALGEVFGWLWKKAIKPAWTLIQKAVKVVWNAYYKPIFKLLRGAVRVLGDLFGWLWKKAIKPAWAGIQKAVQTAWKIVKPLFKNVVDGAKTIGKWMKWLWDKAIKPAWSSIREKIGDVWDKIKPIFENIRDFVKTTLPNAFEKGAKAIGDAWAKIKGWAKTPIKFIVDTLYNKGIVKMVNAIPGDFATLNSIDTSKWASGTSRILPGYTPGRDVHRFVSPTGGALELSGGEAVMRPEWTKFLGAGNVDYLNKAARGGVNALRRAWGRLNGYGGDVGAQPRTPYGRTIKATAGLLNFASGGEIPIERIVQAQKFALRQDPATYQMGAVGPGQYDCSGIVAAVANVLQGMTNPYQRRGGTASFPWTGFRPGHGQFTVGSTPNWGGSGTGHMVGNIMGMRVESRGGEGVVIGQNARSVDDPGFSNVSHLGAGGNFGDGTDLKALRKADALAKKWLAAIDTIKDLVTKVPGWFSDLRNRMGEWGRLILETGKSLADDVRKMLNEKIPNEISVPKAPNVPLPDNPIPKFFDQGGSWHTGTLGINASGKTETVFTNTEMVELSGAIASTAATLRAMIVGDGAGGGLPPLVGELTLNAREDQMPALLSDANMELRRLRRGGAHAKRTTRAPA